VICRVNSCETRGKPEKTTRLGPGTDTGAVGRVPVRAAMVAIMMGRKRMSAPCGMAAILFVEQPSIVTSYSCKAHPPELWKR